MKNWMDLYHQGGITHSQTGKLEVVQKVGAGLLWFFPTGEQWACEDLPCNDRQFDCSCNLVFPDTLCMTCLTSAHLKKGV
jgi:hypothetical protein